MMNNNQQSKTSFSTITLIVITIAVIVLYILHFTQNSGNLNGSDSATTELNNGKKLPIAYVNLDSLLLHYDYSKELQDKVMTKIENNQATINSKGKALESEMMDFQNKVQNNAFLSQERATSAQEKIVRKQQELQILSQKLSNEILEEQAKTNKILTEDIIRQINDYNLEYGKYQVIFSNSANSNILYAEKAYDITDKVIKYFNEKYQATKLKSGKDESKEEGKENDTKE